MCENGGGAKSDMQPSSMVLPTSIHFALKILMNHAPTIFSVELLADAFHIHGPTICFLLWPSEALMTLRPYPYVTIDALLVMLRFGSRLEN